MNENGLSSVSRIIRLMVVKGCKGRKFYQRESHVCLGDRRFTKYNKHYILTKAKAVVSMRTLDFVAFSAAKNGKYYFVRSNQIFR